MDRDGEVDGTAESNGLPVAANYDPVTYERCDHVTGPFFHGTRFAFVEGDLLAPGHPSNFDADRVLHHVYFAALLEPAIWGAELACALRDPGRRGHVYEVEPTGPFEDDPNVTNKRFPGNITQSYRSHAPVRVVREVEDWQGHPPEVLNAMLASLARLRDQGLDVIYD